MNGYWSPAWGMAWALFQVAGVIAAALILKVKYRHEAIELFRAESRILPVSRQVISDKRFSVLPKYAQRIPWLPGVLMRRVLVSSLRIPIYGVAGLLTLYCTQALFLTAETRFDNWWGFSVTVFMVFTGLLLLGRLGVAASGVWFFSFLVGIAVANSLFALVWVAVHGVYPALFEGPRGWLTIALGVPFVLFLSWLAFLVVYAVARIALWTYHAVTSNLSMSPGWMNSALLWTFFAYLLLPDADLKIEWYERFAKFALAPLLIYVATSLIPLILVGKLFSIGDPIRLLYLRSFAYRGRSERLFRNLAANWTEVGPVYALSGPDIVNATLDSKTLSALLGPGLREVFISDTDQLTDRMGRVQDSPSWDALYRVEEFKSKGSVWPTVFGSLLDRCNVAIMDLRGFEVHHTGTAYELMTIIETGAIDKVLFLRDDRTDIHAIEELGNIVLSSPSARPSRDHTRQMSLTEVRGGNLHVSRIALYILFDMVTKKRSSWEE